MPFRENIQWFAENLLPPEPAARTSPFAPVSNAAGAGLRHPGMFRAGAARAANPADQARVGLLALDRAPRSLS
jgi:hypothetical protein